MKTSVIISIFLIAVAILFYSLFKGEDRQESSTIRDSLMTERLLKRESQFLKSKKRRCVENIYIEAESYVDSLIKSIGIEAGIIVDSTVRPFRPEVRQVDSSDLRFVPLEPLFDTFISEDSIPQ